MRAPLDLTPEEQAEEDYWVGLYGAFEPLDLAGVRDFFDGFDRPWWLVGGWSVELFTGVEREHEDLDVSILACDVPALRDFVAGRWHLWTIDEGALRPMTDRFRDLPDPESQLWVRRDGSSPWVMDLPVTPDVDGLWRSKRMPEHVAPLEEVTWVSDAGIRVINPEISLLFKARLERSKDRRDLAAALPLLADDRREWLRDAVRRLHPGHAWLELLDRPGDGKTG